MSIRELYPTERRCVFRTCSLRSRRVQPGTVPVGLPEYVALLTVILVTGSLAGEKPVAWGEDGDALNNVEQTQWEDSFEQNADTLNTMGCSDN